MIVNIPQYINGCVGFNCHASSQSSIAELCAMLLAQDFVSCPYANKSSSAGH